MSESKNRREDARNVGAQNWRGMVEDREKYNVQIVKKNFIYTIKYNAFLY